MNFELEGKLIAIYDTQEITSTFRPGKSQL